VRSRRACLSRTKLNISICDHSRGRREQATEEAEQLHAGGSSEEDALNRLAAIQAAAEILDSNDDLSPADRSLFLSVIRTETTRLHRAIMDIGAITSV
jgi:hypothetical protein